jgi:hypothetical protein
VIVLSLILVIAAAVLLVVGVFQDGLLLVYLSIGSCLAAMALLGAGVLVRRRDGASAAPAYGMPATATAGPAPAITGRQVDPVRPAAREDGVTADETPGREPDTTTPAGPARDEQARDEQAAPARPATTSPAAPTAATPVVKKAVVKKAVVRKATVQGTPVKKAAVKKAVVRRSPAVPSPGGDPASTGAAAPSADAAPRATTGGGLDAVKGLGPAKRQALLERFGDEASVRDASIDELTEVRGVGPALARAIKDTLS